MKTLITTIVINLFFVVQATSQIKLGEISLETNVFLGNYHVGNYQDCYCDYRFVTRKPQEFSVLSNINLNVFFHKRLGIQLGFQSYQLKYFNDDFILGEIVGGFDPSISQDYNYKAESRNQYYAMPINLIYHQPLTRKLGLRILAGGSPRFQHKFKTTIIHKDSGEEEITKGKREDTRNSKFQPQFMTQLNYSILPKLDLSLGLMMKFNSGNNYYYGLGLGLSYKIKE